jgi:hypothetical protein
MKRRDWLRNAITTSALAASTQAPPLQAQTPPAQTPPAQTPPASSNQEIPKLKLAAPDAVAEGSLKFFSPTEFQTLQSLAKILVPAFNGRPGAVEADVPQFLDFLLSQSPTDRQSLYRQGLAALGASFGDHSANLSALLAPLRQPWTFDPPADPLARFLRAAKDDVLSATMNSREWAASNKSRTGTGSNYYYFTIE